MRTLLALSLLASTAHATATNQPPPGPGVPQQPPTGGQPVVLAPEGSSADLWGDVAPADQQTLSGGVVYDAVDFEPLDLTGPWQAFQLMPRPPQLDAATVQQPIVYRTRTPTGVSILPSFQAHDVLFRINDLDTITREVVPEVADAAGVPSRIDLATETLASGHFPCHDWSLKLRDVGMDLPIGSNTMDSVVANNVGRVNTDLDMPGVDASATLRMHITWDPNPSEWACVQWLMDIGGDTDLFGSIDDLDGELDVTLEDSASSVQVDEIKKLRLDLTGTHIGSSAWFLDFLLDVGFTLYDLFDSSCSGMDQCMSEAINDLVLSSDEVVDTLTSVINDAIDVPLSLNGGLSNDGFEIDYGVDLSDLTTSSTYGTVTTRWAVEVESDAATDPCANALTLRAYTGAAGSAPATTSDLEAEVPFSIVTKAAYLAGKQGAFCTTSTYNGTRLSVKPNGALSLAAGAVGDPADSLRLSLPVKVTPTGRGVSGSLTATMTVVAAIEVGCDADELQLVPSSILLGTVTGSIVVSGINIPGSAMQSTLNAAVAAIPLAEIDVMPRVTDLDDLGDIMVAVDDVVVRNQHVVIGLDIGDDACESAGGGGGGGGGGYDPGPGFLPPWQLDPWDIDVDDEIDPATFETLTP
ncbi:MAG TPA: hypothetical protein PKA64_07430 [Myxococcota bacterium]|nr:hypothetical protein [Myxococcota bacterium]